MAGRSALIPSIQEPLRRLPTSSLLDSLDSAGVPCGTIRALDEVFGGDERGTAHCEPLARADGQIVPTLASPMRLSLTPVACRHPAPALGEGNRDVLADLLGLSPDEIDALRDSGALGAG